MGDDFCHNTFLGSSMKYTGTIKSRGTISNMIQHEMKVKMNILLHLSWSNVPTLTGYTQLASVLSISCKIQHLTQQHGQQKIQLSKLQKQTSCEFWRVNIANKYSSFHFDVTKQAKVRATFRQTRFEYWEHCAGYNRKRTVWQRNDGKCTI